MKRFLQLFWSTLLFINVVAQTNAFTISINGDNGTLGETVANKTCQQAGEESFTSDAHLTKYTSKESYGGGRAYEMTALQGKTGFGHFGGIVNFTQCGHAGGRVLVKGEEIWIRFRIKFPRDFQFNSNGRNKFLRLRTFHDENGTPVSEGYNDLYIDGPPGTEPHKGRAPFQYIFEGAAKWYRLTDAPFFEMGKWETIEYHIRLDDQKGTEGGNSMMRVWLNGNLIGETNDRNTLKTPESYINSLYFFTYWDNEGADKTQTLWVDDLVITSDRPSEVDANGNPFIGMGELHTFPRPLPPHNLQIDRPQ
ncbi:MAG: hypothetical protein ACI9CO_000231 [Candidatus Azotimanducaceae bacterium]|jgi:hypothetical protein